MIYNWFLNVSLNLKIIRTRSFYCHQTTRLRPRRVSPLFGCTSRYQLLHRSGQNRLYSKSLSFHLDLLCGNVALTVRKCGVSHAKSQQVLRILDRFMVKGCDWRCHCTVKTGHYCPISEILHHIRFESSKGKVHFIQIYLSSRIFCSWSFSLTGQLIKT